ncbi:unnamed protein product [Ilex paraguariensis]|uniref:Uncharacterized protein n=1 Tax=Ilex paraguariensis TaxID=185542 RepID=A0ABC8R387_9AQUA
MPSRMLSGEDTDSDDGFEVDMEALRSAWFLNGKNPTDLQQSSTSHHHRGASSDLDSDDSEEEDDLELVRDIQRRFAISTDLQQPLTLKPLCSLPPVGSDDDYEDDFETLRAIQRRFEAYNSCDNESLESFGDNIDGTTQPSDLIEWHGSGAKNAATLPVKDSSFPRSAQAFLDAIKKNRSFQKFIRCKLMQIEARIEEIKQLKERVKILKDFQASCKKRTGRALSQKKDARVQLISVRKPGVNAKVNEKKVPALYYGPAENSHVANYRMALTRFPLSLNRERWTKEEKENLAKGIKQQFQEMLLQKSVDLLRYVPSCSVMI